MASMRLFAPRFGGTTVLRRLKLSCSAGLMLNVLATPNLPAEPVAADVPPGYRIVNRIPMADGWWDFASFDPAHRRVFVSRGNGVFRLDIDTGKVDQRIVPGSEGRASLVLPGGDEVLATMAGYAIAIQFDAGSGDIHKVYDLVQQGNAAVWDPASNLAWIMGGRGEATLIDTQARREVGRVTLSGEVLEFAAVDGKGKLFVHSAYTAEIIVVDTLARRVTGHYKLLGCEVPTGLAYVSKDGVLISACANGVVKALNAQSGAEVGSLPIGRDADAVIYDAERRLAFVPAADDGALYVISVQPGGALRLLERAPTQIGTRTGALDTKTGFLYLPAARFGPKHQLGWADALVGTVELLVMAPRIPFGTSQAKGD